MVVPEFKWPTTPLTLASTNFWAAAVPCLGSAASSSATSSNLTFLPPIDNAFGIQVFNGQAGTVFVVLTQVGDGAADGAHVSNLDHLFLAPSQGLSRPSRLQEQSTGKEAYFENAWQNSFRF
jgi:hypothetical protein